MSGQFSAISHQGLGGLGACRWVSLVASDPMSSSLLPGRSAAVGGHAGPQASEEVGIPAAVPSEDVQALLTLQQISGFSFSRGGRGRGSLAHARRWQSLLPKLFIEEISSP